MNTFETRTPQYQLNLLRDNLYRQLRTAESRTQFINPENKLELVRNEAVMDTLKNVLGQVETACIGGEIGYRTRHNNEWVQHWIATPIWRKTDEFGMPVLKTHVEDCGYKFNRDYVKDAASIEELIQKHKENENENEH